MISPFNPLCQECQQEREKEKEDRVKEKKQKEDKKEKGDIKCKRQRVRRKNER